jgi:hypothetical protein
VAILLGALAADPVAGKVYLTQAEALAAAFPSPARSERRTLFLDDAQAALVERESGQKLVSRLVVYYVGMTAGRAAGYAYFDTHLVRTLPETIMIRVNPDGTVGRITVLSFSEPEDYLPREAWLGQFPGRGLDSDLALRRGIRNLTGASLTANAITAACRRILAIHRVVRSGSP